MTMGAKGHCIIVGGIKERKGPGANPGGGQVSAEDVRCWWEEE